LSFVSPVSSFATVYFWACFYPFSSFFASCFCVSSGFSGFSVFSVLSSFKVFSAFSAFSSFFPASPAERSRKTGLIP